ncbi:MAG: dihydrodipicolinate synthase family protein [Trueperaceae bacterium]|nr:dihydrodipicolinate synthase family protein [Trueperaceae bacterium]
MLRPTGLIAATFTPMHDDGRLWLERIGDVVDHLVDRGIDGLYVCGSTGEGPLLSGAERRAVAEAYVRAARGRLPVIVQVGHTSLVEASELAAHAQAVGADAISATPPTYFKPAGLDGVVDAMAIVAAGAPELPFFYYHIPSMTGVPVDVSALMPRAAERVPTLAGVKFSAPTTHEFATLDLERFQVLFGADEMLLAGILAGAHGAVGSTYNLIPAPYRAAMAALEQGDLVAARAHQRLATRIVMRLVRDRPIPFLKAAMALTGLGVGPTRAPLTAPTAAEFAALREDLDAAGYLSAFRADAVGA